MNYEQAKAIGIESNWQQYCLINQAFMSNSPIWQKKKRNVNCELQKIFKSQKFQFYKVGKTLGFETNRYIEYLNGILYYYQGEKDKQCKGYCILENIYLYYFKLGDHFIMHLTNGTQFSTFHFTNTDFMKYNQSLLLKDVVQINVSAKYDIVNQIGEGTFSKVYLGVNKFFKYPVALKIVPKLNQVDDIYTKNIVMQEKRILRFLKSQLIGEMYQFYEDENNFIFVLEYLQGKDLSIYFKQKKQFSSAECVFILKQILKALIQLHHKNIIHRDLKPHNIIFNPQKNSIKLIDFGLSLLFDEHTELNKYMRCGTMGYIAPEVVNNSPNNKKKYDCKSDMFGFGIIAHMLLLGYNPIRGRNYRQTVERNLACNLNFDKKIILDKYGQDCYILLYSLLQKEPHLRPTAQQALQSPFLQMQHIDMPVTNSEVYDKKIKKNISNDDANLIEDKLFGADNQKLHKEQIMSPKTPSWKYFGNNIKFQ